MLNSATKAPDTQGKKVHIEFLRILAAFLVIVNHTNSQIFLGTQPSGIWFASLWYFFESKAAVPVFVMIMGAVLLEKQDTLKKSVQRFGRIAVVTIIFTLLSGAVYGYGISQPAKALQQIINSKAAPHWYLYLYMGLLLILPFMQKLTKALDKKDIQVLIFVTVVIGGFAPMLQHIGFKVHDAFFLGIFSPYIGMAFAGYYIEKYTKPAAKQAWLALGGFAALVLLQVLVTFRSWHSRNGTEYLWLDDAKYAPVALSAICLYFVVKYIFSAVKLTPKASSFICYMGSLTFGIYLIADFFKAPLAFIYHTLAVYITPMPAMIIYQLCIFVCAAAVTAVLKLIPAVKKLI